MQNGTEFTAFVEDVVRFLEGKKSVAYYQEPLPSPTDEEMAGIVGRFVAATPEQREQFLRSLTNRQRALFGIYGHRAATLAVRQKLGRQALLYALVGAAIANYQIPQKRRVELALAVYHHCARVLGFHPAELFAAAAEYASPEMAEMMRSFGKRGDVTLSKFGWRELKTPDGVRFKFEWK